MEQLQAAFEPYRHVDPIGWVGLYRFLPVWAGLLAIVLGVLMILFGGGRLFRLVAGPLGAAIATIWAGLLAAKLGFGSMQKGITLISTFALLGAGFLFPPIVVFFAFGVPLGLLAGQLAGSTDWLLGFVPGFMVGGAVGVVLHRVVGAVLSSIVGGWTVMMGLMASVAPFLPGAVNFLAGNAITTVCIAACFAVAGIVYQLFVRPPPEEAERLKHQKHIKKKKDKEQKELEARWSNYTKDHKKAGDE